MMKMLLPLMTVLLLWQRASSIEEKCRECICANSRGRTGDAGTCSMPSVSTDCLEADNTKYCGPYGMTDQYWDDAGSINGDFYNCMGSWDCANKTLDAYLTRYCISQFVGHSAPCSCEEQVRLHHCGPYSIHADFCNAYYASDIAPCMSH